MAEKASELILQGLVSETEPQIRIRGPVVSKASTALLSAPVIAVAVVLLAGLALRMTPGLERWRLWQRPSPKQTLDRGLLNPADERVGDTEVTTETRTRSELAQPEHAELKAPTTSPIAQTVDDDFVVPKIDAKTPPRSIEDERGSLTPFYAALARTLQQHSQSGPINGKPAITRILYHGDSVVASDYVTGTLRRAFQDKFGDAGHGFVLMADAWPSYFHNDIFRYASKGWKLSRVVGPYTPDGYYGLGGVSFKAPPGVRARFGTAEKGKYGRKVSRFRLLYLKQPYGGELKINLDGKPYGVVDTEAETPSSGYYDITTDDGPHLLEVITAKRFTRTFGVIMERDVPGVVLDAIGIQGARLRFLDKQDDAHWAEQLKLRDPNLIVYEFGANESGDGFAYSMEDYHRTMKEVLLQAKRAVPEAGCLVLAAMDRARKQGEWTVTLPIIPLIVKEQEATAKEVGCAFWNTYEAMGGRGSMAKWVRRGLGQADMTHPSGYGAQVLGNWIFQALMEGFNRYVEKQHGRPLEPAKAPTQDAPDSAVPNGPTQ